MADDATVAPKPSAAGRRCSTCCRASSSELRHAGLPVSLTENLDAMEAVQHIPIEDREAFKYALAATLVKNHVALARFETVFEVYFSLRGAGVQLDRATSAATAPSSTRTRSARRRRATARARAPGGVGRVADARGARRDALPGAAEAATRR